MSFRSTEYADTDSTADWRHGEQLLEVYQDGRPKSRMKVLDACLRALEDANERGEKTVTPTLVGPLQTHVPSLLAGQPISDALEIVFSEQELCLGIKRAPRGEPGGVRRRLKATHEVTALVYDAARKLTDRIREDLAPPARTCVFLLEAHNERAWAALGYSTWAEYVSIEFSLSRSRSYELLDQARVIQVLREASGMSGIPDISAHWAVEMKPHLETVVAEIRDRTAFDSAPSAHTRSRIVREIVEQKMTELAARRRSFQASATHPGSAAMPVPIESEGRAEADGARITSVDADQLRQAIAYLAGMPPVMNVIRSIGGEIQISGHELGLASRWLDEFAHKMVAVER